MLKAEIMRLGTRRRNIRSLSHILKHNLRGATVLQRPVVSRDVPVATTSRCMSTILTTTTTTSRLPLRSPSSSSSLAEQQYHSSTKTSQQQQQQAEPAASWRDWLRDKASNPSPEFQLPWSGSNSSDVGSVGENRKEDRLRLLFSSFLSPPLEIYPIQGDAPLDRESRFILQLLHELYLTGQHFRPSSLEFRKTGRTNITNLSGQHVHHVLNKGGGVANNPKDYVTTQRCNQVLSRMLNSAENEHSRFPERAVSLAVRADTILRTMNLFRQFQQQNSHDANNNTSIIISSNSISRNNQDQRALMVPLPLPNADTYAIVLRIMVAAQKSISNPDDFQINAHGDAAAADDDDDAKYSFLTCIPRRALSIINDDMEGYHCLVRGEIDYVPVAFYWNCVLRMWYYAKLAGYWKAPVEAYKVFAQVVLQQQPQQQQQDDDATDEQKQKTNSSSSSRNGGNSTVISPFTRQPDPSTYFWMMNTCSQIVTAGKMDESAKLLGAKVALKVWQETIEQSTKKRDGDTGASGGATFLVDVPDNLIPHFFANFLQAIRWLPIQEKGKGGGGGGGGNDCLRTKYYRACFQYAIEQGVVNDAIINEVRIHSRSKEIIDEFFGRLDHLQNHPDYRHVKWYSSDGSQIIFENAPKSWSRRLKEVGQINRSQNRPENVFLERYGKGY